MKGPAPDTNFEVGQLSRRHIQDWLEGSVTWNPSPTKLQCGETISLASIVVRTRIADFGWSALSTSLTSLVARKLDQCVGKRQRIQQLWSTRWRSTATDQTGVGIIGQCRHQAGNYGDGLSMCIRTTWSCDEIQLQACTSTGTNCQELSNIGDHDGTQPVHWQRSRWSRHNPSLNMTMNISLSGYQLALVVSGYRGYSAPPGEQ